MSDILPDPVLSVRDLRIGVGKQNEILHDVSFDILPGETYGLVGESGSGKSITGLSVMGLLKRPLEVTGGSIVFQGQNVLKLGNRARRRLRGDRMAMVFQEPMTALNPLATIGRQIAEMFVVHRGMGWSDARRKAVEALESVRVPSPEERARSYPHQLSGGMRQRVMVAIALACRPDLLIADEPTTALDVTIQAQILALIVDLQKTLGTGLVLITHDLGVVAQTAQRVIVMYAGKKVEEATVEDLFANPRHPYTRGLMASMPAVISFGARTDARLNEIPGMVPSLTNLPPGCAFAPRCSLAIDRCRAEYPPLQEVDGDHFAACWRAAELVGAP